jgi:hypothetical protein
LRRERGVELVTRGATGEPARLMELIAEDALLAAAA